MQLQPIEGINDPQGHEASDHTNGHIDYEIEEGKDVIENVICALAEKEEFPNEKLHLVRALLEQLEPEINNHSSRPLLSDEEIAVWQKRPEDDIDGEAGKIPGCRACGGECCNFGKHGNLIFAPEAEICGFHADTTVRTNHLQVKREFSTGGLHVFCSVKHNGCVGCAPNQDGIPGAKPWDCAIYPAFTEVSDENVIRIWFADNRSPQEGIPPKCQLSWWDRLAQIPFVVQRFKEMLEEHPELVNIYRNAIKGMVGYREFNPIFLSKLTDEEIKMLLELGKKLQFARYARKVTNGPNAAEQGEAVWQYFQAVKDKFDQATENIDAYRYAEWAITSST